MTKTTFSSLIGMINYERWILLQRNYFNQFFACGVVRCVYLGKQPKPGMATPLTPNPAYKCMTKLFSHVLLIVHFLTIVESQSIIESLPGYSGSLPFKLETGQVLIRHKNFYFPFIFTANLSCGIMEYVTMKVMHFVTNQVHRRGRLR